MHCTVRSYCEGALRLQCRYYWGGPRHTGRSHCLHAVMTASMTLSLLLVTQPTPMKPAEIQERVQMIYDKYDPKNARCVAATPTLAPYLGVDCSHTEQ